MLPLIEFERNIPGSELMKYMETEMLDRCLSGRKPKYYGNILSKSFKFNWAFVSALNEVFVLSLL